MLRKSKHIVLFDVFSSKYTTSLLTTYVFSPYAFNVGTYPRCLYYPKCNMRVSARMFTLQWYLWKVHTKNVFEFEVSRVVVPPVFIKICTWTLSVHAFDCVLLFKYNFILSASVRPLSLVDYSRMYALAPSFSLNVHGAAAI